ELVKTEAAVFVVRAERHPRIKGAVRQAVLKASSLARRGISSLQEVQTELAKQDMELSVDQLRSVVGAIPNLRSHGDWFWDLTSRDNRRNRIVNLTCKMLTINSPLRLATLREGMRRHGKYRGRIAPPPPLA